jgi:hypothetical protein
LDVPYRGGAELDRSGEGFHDTLVSVWRQRWDGCPDEPPPGCVELRERLRGPDGLGKLVAHVFLLVLVPVWDECPQPLVSVADVDRVGVNIATVCGDAVPQPTDLGEQVMRVAQRGIRPFVAVQRSGDPVKLSDVHAGILGVATCFWVAGVMRYVSR